LIYTAATPRHILEMTRPIVILGFMGCGKTTVGQALARKLDVDFIDLDSQITKNERRSPAQIIEANGEAAFREVETRALADVLRNHQAAVIALGGGAWTIPANRTLVALHDCYTVWLDTPFETCWQRISENTAAVRPLAPDQQTARSRYESRRPLYALADQLLSVSVNDSVEKIVEEILHVRPAD
jgi:shikimate kinase